MNDPKQDLPSAVASIIDDWVQVTQFWPHCRDWAPNSTADKLEAAELSRVLSLALTLRDYLVPPTEDEAMGRLILGWATVGALTEGALALLLVVFNDDYASTQSQGNSRDYRVHPEDLWFAQLIKFACDHVAIESQVGEWRAFLDLVQQNRNAIHLLKPRPLDDWDQLSRAICEYANFLSSVNSRLPYP